MVDKSNYSLFLKRVLERKKMRWRKKIEIYWKKKIPLNFNKLEERKEEVPSSCKYILLQGSKIIDTTMRRILRVLTFVSCNIKNSLLDGGRVWECLYLI